MPVLIEVEVLHKAFEEGHMATYHTCSMNTSCMIRTEDMHTKIGRTIHTEDMRTKTSHTIHTKDVRIETDCTKDSCMDTCHMTRS